MVFGGLRRREDDGVVLYCNRHAMVKSGGGQARLVAAGDSSGFGSGGSVGRAACDRAMEVEVGGGGGDVVAGVGFGLCL